MAEEKDYLGEKLRQVERGRENAYFRKLDQELLEKLRQQEAEELEEAIRAYTRMRCPKCGEPLQEMTYHRVKVDECTGCGGIWLDKGELETLAGPKEEGWLQRFYEVFIPPRP
jgi:uncharacterized protein with PIN domain